MQRVCLTVDFFKVTTSQHSNIMDSDKREMGKALQISEGNPCYSPVRAHLHMEVGMAV